jgi:hypothetical protein
MVPDTNRHTNYKEIFAGNLQRTYFFHVDFSVRSMKKNLAVAIQEPILSPGFFITFFIQKRAGRWIAGISAFPDSFVSESSFGMTSAALGFMTFGRQHGGPPL